MEHCQCRHLNSLTLKTPAHIVSVSLLTATASEVATYSPECLLRSGHMFWATRMGLSKDNFWTSAAAPALAVMGYGADSPFNGLDAELHAIAAVLTGVGSCSSRLTLHMCATPERHAQDP